MIRDSRPFPSAAGWLRVLTSSLEPGRLPAVLNQPPGVEIGAVLGVGSCWLPLHGLGGV